LPTFLLNKKRFENKKTLKSVKIVTKIKNVKKRFLHLWGRQVFSIGGQVIGICLP